MRLLALALVFALSACAFSSERPLFSSGQAAHPFADGAIFLWRESANDPDAMQLVFRRVGAGYNLYKVGDEEEPLNVMFVAIRDTPEEDYIAQVWLSPTAPGRAYAFVWKSGDSYRIFAGPSAVDESEAGAAAMDRYCAARPNGECQVNSRRAVMDLYRRAVRPVFVIAGRDNDDLIELTPIGAEGAKPPT